MCCSLVFVLLYSEFIELDTINCYKTVSIRVSRIEPDPSISMSLPHPLPLSLFREEIPCFISNSQLLIQVWRLYIYIVDVCFFNLLHYTDIIVEKIQIY